MSSSDQPELDELISLSEAAELTGLSASHLRLLVRQGEIWGRKLGRNWLTTEQAAREYLAQENKPGPKPKSDTEDLAEG
ncbi:MAG: helix-turn-helix domain-containing protein [Chloroflexi bacterium]|nr:helix-turn-helix domain-containing protein [Chloroflexota bacterium]